MDLSDRTGTALDGWASVQQSIATVLATRLETRVFRRDFGSDLGTLIDAPMNDETTLALYVAVAEALDRWEPRFALTEISLVPDASGVVRMELHGSYLPRAHMGNDTPVEDGTRAVRLMTDRAESWRLAA